MTYYLALIIFGMTISGCGKKGPLEPLEQSDFPRTYPKPVETKVPS